MLRIPDWIINPFLDARSEKTGVPEEKIVLLQNDIELRSMFKKSCQDFWLQKKFKIFIQWATMEQGEDLFHCLSTSYLVERGFSAVVLLLSQQRNRLKITERGNLRLFLSEFQPDVKKLVSLHQVHPFH